MHSRFLDRLPELPRSGGVERADLEQVVRDAGSTVEELHARLDDARRRLARAEERASSAASFAARVGVIILDAQRLVEDERVEAERVASALDTAAAASATRIVAAAREEAMTLRALSAELRLASSPPAQVLGFEARAGGVVETPGWDVDRVAAS